MVRKTMESEPELDAVTDVDAPQEEQDQEFDKHKAREILRDECTFIGNVAQFFNKKDLSDVTLKVGDVTYHGHKFVLAKSSDVFKTMLYDGSWSKGDDAEVILTESSECQAVFDGFLRFLYTAEITITVDSAVGILCLSDKYNVKSLKQLCVQYMVQNTKSPRVRNAVTWYNWAKALNLDELVESCSRTIAWNVDTILGASEWFTMDLNFIRDILTNSSLVVANEYSLYKGLEAWLLADNHVANLKSNAETLLPLIRFPQMHVGQLFSVELSSLFTRDCTKGVLKELVGKAYRYRSLCPALDKLAVTFGDEFYKARNYMDLAVDSVRMQNTLRFGLQVDVRSYVGPVIPDEREGEWKITYRKHENTWTIQMFCHESATINGEANIEASVLVVNEDKRVIQVETFPPFVCSRTKSLTETITIDDPEDAKNMVLLIKPLP